MKIGYTNLISSEVQNTGNLVRSQSISGRKLSMIIAPGCEKTRGWAQKDNLKSFFKFTDAEKSEGRNLFSVAAADDFGFGAFTLEDYGTDQIITTDKDDIDLLWKKGFHITAVCTWSFDFYFVMTKGVEEFVGKAQTWHFSSSWSSVEKQIRKGWENKVITGLCFSAKTEKYLLVLTESDAGQSYKWDISAKYLNDKSSKGYQPTIVFHDLTNDRVLTVLTTGKGKFETHMRLRHPLET